MELNEIKKIIESESVIGDEDFNTIMEYFEYEKENVEDYLLVLKDFIIVYNFKFKKKQYLRIIKLLKYFFESQLDTYTHQLSALLLICEYYAIGDYAKCFDIYYRINNYDEMPDTIRFSCYNTLANIFLELDLYDEALDTLHKIFKLESFEDMVPTNRSTFFLNCSLVYVSLEEQSNVQKYLNLAKTEIKNLNREDNKWIFETIEFFSNYAALVHYSKNNKDLFDQEVKIYKEFLENKLTSEGNMIDCHLRIIDLLIKNGYLDIAKEAMIKMQEVFNFETLNQTRIYKIKMDLCKDRNEELFKKNRKLFIQTLEKWRKEEKQNTTLNICHQLDFIARNEEFNKKERLFLFDSLTHCYNRNAYKMKLEENDTSFEYNAVIFIDLVDLKKCNDELGHQYGDLYLKESSKIFIKYFGVENIYRIGGDEFVILIENDSRDRIEHNLNNCVMKEKKIEFFNNCPFKCRFHAGISIVNNHKIGMEDYIKRADQTMYLCRYKYKDKKWFAFEDEKYEEF